MPSKRFLEPISNAPPARVASSFPVSARRGEEGVPCGTSTKPQRSGTGKLPQPPRDMANFRNTLVVSDSEGQKHAFALAPRSCGNWPISRAEVRLRWVLGQSLIEILVAVAVGVILILGAITLIAPALTTNTNVERARTAGALGKELFENARVLSEKNWHAMDSIATTSATRYYIVASSSPFTVATGTESVSVGTTTYSRYFFLDDVYRNASGKIDTGGSALDPSTKKITVVYVWPPNASNTIVGYFGRYGDMQFHQTDWSGGSGQEGPVTATSVNSRFSSSSGIDVSTTTGSIRIQGI